MSSFVSAAGGARGTARVTAMVRPASSKCVGRCRAKNLGACFCPMLLAEVTGIQPDAHLQSPSPLCLVLMYMYIHNQFCLRPFDEAHLTVPCKKSRAYFVIILRITLQKRKYVFCTPPMDAPRREFFIRKYIQFVVALLVSRQINFLCVRTGRPIQL